MTAEAVLAVETAEAALETAEAVTAGAVLAIVSVLVQ